MKGILEQIRTAIKSSGHTRYRISKDTGIGEPQLCKLMHEQAGLSVESLERLAVYLNLEIIIRPKRKRKGGK